MERRLVEAWRISTCSLMLVILAATCLSQTETAKTCSADGAVLPSVPKVVLFSWDGVQYNHLMELYDSGNLTNLRELVTEPNLPILRALTTDHTTETNCAHPSLLSGMGQGTTEGCPDNITVWENIETWDSSWVTGAVAGKSKFSTVIFPDAKNDVDFWYAGDTVASVVTDLALSFVQNHSDESFFLFVHYREPDYAGHNYGENTQQYDNALIECDTQLGRILTLLEGEGIRDSTAILVSTDHGFREGGTTHSGPAWGVAGADPDLFTVWIASDRGTVNLSEADTEFWDQNDVAPTIYSLIGLDDYGSRWPYIRGSALWDRSFDVRDVAVTDIHLPTTTVAPNETVEINVTVENQGNYTEIPTISVYGNSTLIYTKTLAYPDIPLSSHGENASKQTVTFTWNVNGNPPGTYVISARADVVAAGGATHPSLAYTKNETYALDNVFVDGFVEVVVHDVAVVSVAADRDWVYEGHEIGVNVSVRNEGSAVEAVNVTLYCDSGMTTEIGTASAVLAPQEAMTMSFTWNTTNVPHQDCPLTAIASTLNPDIDPADNALSDGTVRVRILGDANGDDVVNMSDLWLLALAFGSTEASQGWVSDYDLNLDGIIDMLDLYLAAVNFGHS